MPECLDACEPKYKYVDFVKYEDFMECIVSVRCVGYLMRPMCPGRLRHL